MISFTFVTVETPLPSPDFFRNLSIDLNVVI